MRKTDPLEQYLRRPSRNRLAKAIREHYEFVWRTAFRLTGNREDAKDICQDVFLKLLLQPPVPERVSSVRGFLTWRVLSRVEHQRRSSERRRQRERTHAQHLFEVHPGVDHPGAEGFDPVDFDALNTAIRALPQDLRLAVELRYLGGMSSQEIASALDVSERTIQRRLEEARDRLKARLAPHFAGALFLGPGLQGLTTPPPPADLLPGLLRIDQMGAALQVWPAGTGSGVKVGIGGLAEGGKKIAVLAVLTLTSIAGGLLLFNHFFWRERDAGGHAVRMESGVNGTDPFPGTRLPGTAAPSIIGDGLKRGFAGGPQSVSIHGRITAWGKGPVGEARVVALSVEKWQEIDKEEDWEWYQFFSRDDSKELQKLREAYLACAKDLPEARSKADGTYAFRGLSAGIYRLLVEHSDYLPRVDSWIPVRALGPAECNVELVPGETITGRVVDASGRPVHGAKIEVESLQRSALKGRNRIQRIREEWKEGWILVNHRKVVSALDGSFQLVSLEPIHHLITVRKEGFLDAEAHEAAGRRDVVLTLKRGSTIRGRLLDPARQPLAEAEVTLIPEKTGEVHKFYSGESVDWSFAGEEKRSTRSQKDGRFEIPGFRKGGFDLRVSAEKYPPIRMEILVEESIQDLGDLVLDAPRSVAGTVYMPDGIPAAGARVWIEEPSKKVNVVWSRGWWIPGMPLAETSSKPDGRFLFRGLPSGSVRVKASAGDGARGEAANVRGGTDDVKIFLGSGLTLQGKVVDELTSKPVPGAQVVIGSEGKHHAETDGEGRFKIQGVYKPPFGRSWTSLRTHHPDFKPFWLSIVRQGWSEDRPLLIRLERRATVTGRISDSQGRPIGGATVWFEMTGFSGRIGAATQASIQAHSGDNGFFSAPVPSPLSTRYAVSGDPIFFLVASHSRIGNGRAGPFHLPDTGKKWPESVNIVLAPSSTLEGMVTDGEGMPVRGARIQFKRLLSSDLQTQESSTSIQMLYQVYSRPDGSYRIEELERGVFEISASAMGYAQQKILDLKVDRAVVSQDIFLTRGGTVEGRVTDTEGRPIENADVIAIPEGELPKEDDKSLSEFGKRMSLLQGMGEVSARTGADGSYRLEHLSPGAYSIVGRREGYEAARISPIRRGDSPPDLVLCRFSALGGNVRASDTKDPITVFSVEVFDKSKLSPLFEKLQSADGTTLISALSTKDINNLYSYHEASEGRLEFQHPAGRFLFDGLRPGEYVFLVRAPGFGLTFEEASLQNGQETLVQVSLKRGGCIEGVVLDGETGDPIPGAEIYYRAREVELQVKPHELSVTTDEEGTFSLCGLSISPFSGPRRGTYTVKVTHPFYLPERTRPLDVLPGGEPVRVEVRLAPAGRLEGRIAGLPTSFGRLEGLSYELFLEKTDADGKRRKVSSTGSLNVHLILPEGRYFADSLAPGTYRLEFKKQEVEPGEVRYFGLVGFSQAAGRLGPEEIFSPGDVEIQAWRTTRFDFVAH